KAKGIYDSIVGQFTSKEDAKKDDDILDDLAPDEAVEENEPILSDEEIKSVEDEFGVFVEARDDGYEAMTEDDTPESIDKRNAANENLNKMYNEAKAKRPDAKVETPEEAEARNSRDDNSYQDEAETEAKEVFKHPSV